MARQKDDGRGRMGGIQKGYRYGKVNRVREIWADLLEGRTKEIEEAFDSLSPRDKIEMAIKISTLVVPRPVEVKQNNLILGGGENLVSQLIHRTSLPVQEAEEVD